MIAPTVLAGALLALAAQEAQHVDASLDLQGELLDRRFVDLDGDGRLELALALRTPRGTRELRLHEIGAARVEPEPFVTVPMLEDVLALGFGDVRDEPGRELLLLTRSGVHSYSTALEGYRDNARRLLEAELIYDVPDPRALPFWDYVLPAPGGDRVLVPVHAGFEVFGPAPPEERAETAAAYLRLAQIASAGSRSTSLDSRGERRRGSRRGPVEVRVEGKGASGLFFGDSFPGETAPGADAFLGDNRSVRAPALADLDGDGRLELLVWNPPVLEVYRDEGAGFSGEPARVERAPAYLDEEGRDLSLTLADLDGDGDPDLLAELRADVDGFENAEHTLLALIHDGERLFPEAPDQVFRFEAGLLRAEVADVDRDGRPDLVVRQFELPSLIETVTSLEFELTHLLFRGEAGGERPFERKPALKHEERFDEDSVAAAAANRTLRMDCDGDGIADLVEVDLEGYVAIRRLKRSSGFLSGKGWSLDAEPWKRFEVRGSIESLEVLDLNGDGIGDVVSEGDQTLAILLSVDPRRRGGQR